MKSVGKLALTKNGEKRNDNPENAWKTAITLVTVSDVTLIVVRYNMCNGVLARNAC